MVRVIGIKLKEKKTMEMNVTEQFISEVVQQLIPYLLQDNTENNDVDDMTYDEMKYILESNGATVIDWDEVMLEEEKLVQKGK